MQVTASEICRGVHVPSSSRDAHAAKYRSLPLYPGGGQRVNHVASIWGLEGLARIAEPPRLQPSPRPHLTAWGGLPHSGDVLVQGGGGQFPPASRSSLMFTQLQKVDRSLQPSSVAAKILKRKWLAGLVPLEKTLASPPVTLLPWVPTWRGKAGGKARRQDAKKKPVRSGLRWGGASSSNQRKTFEQSCSVGTLRAARCATLCT